MTTTYHLLQWLSQYTSSTISFSCSAKSKNNSTDRIKEMVTKFSEKPKSQNTAFVYCIALYNLAISHVILSQIFDTARNAYCILSDQYSDNSSCFLLW